MSIEANQSALRFMNVSDEFIAFIYAAGVHVFLDKAHDGELFHNFSLTVCVVGSIFFFAQDWLSRFGGFRRIGAVKPAAFYIKQRFSQTG